MAFYHRVRLPFYFSQPQFPVDEEIYTLANGTRRVLRSNVSKEYVAKTDWLPAEIHERLAIALRHDVVNVEGDKLVAGVRINGAYEIEWQEFLDHPVAPAKFKALIEAYVARNTRCGICVPSEFNITVRDDVLPEPLDEGSTTEIDVAANDDICCDGAVFSIVEFDSDYIDSISIDPDTGVVTMELKTPLESTGEVVFFTYKVECADGSQGIGQVRGGIVGSLSTPCEQPVDVQVVVTTPWDGTATASWTAPGSPPANGYHWYLYEDGVGEIASGDTMGLSVNLTGLETDKDYIFYVRSVCEESTSPYSFDAFSTISAVEDWYQYSVLVGTICSETPNLLYSASPFGVGVQMFLEPALINPLVGYEFILLQSSGIVRSINPANGVVGGLTGDSC